MKIKNRNHGFPVAKKIKHSTLLRKKENMEHQKYVQMQNRGAGVNRNIRYILLDPRERIGKVVPQFAQLFPTREDAETVAQTLNLSVTNVYEVNVYFTEV